MADLIADRLREGAMSQPRNVRRIRLPSLPRALRGGGGLVLAALAAMAVIYLGYDLAKGRLSPCEGIFQETSIGLSTHIKVLRAEAALEIGRETLTELDERAQMAALNLKTCCTVLDAGRLDPEQFLQCKARARAYDAEVEDIVAIVRTAVGEAARSAAPAAADAAPAAKDAAPAARAAIESKVERAREVSRTFNKEVVEVRREQALQSLAAMPVEHVEVTAEEREPNDSPLATNVVELGKWVTASIGAASDADYFTFTTPPTYRDRIRIEIQNRSTALEPRVELFDAGKSSLGNLYKTTAGSDLTYTFVASPGTPYIVRVSNYYGQSTGVYLLSVAATQAYDAKEPNDDILHAAPIKIGETVAANIMDPHDADVFSFEVGDGEHALTAALANRSTSLHPRITVLDAAKTEIGNAHNTTPGGDARHAFKAKGPATYYVRVGDYYGNGAGDYALAIAAP